ncbi:MAG: hypothetical protein LBC02_06965 [Planctomycetaceae bacterium]|jgi:hypothetical protein|nr:hypothetical protein [Planctomycetaceae bacterium]
MLQRFIKWVDSLGDYVNPLVVRDVRRMFRNPGYLGLFYLYSVSIILIVIINWNDKREFADVSLIVASVICCIGAFWGFMVINEMAAIFYRDELFLMNSLSPRQYLHAYITISSIESLFIISLSLPLLTAAQIIGVENVSSLFLYIIPILAFLAGQAFSLFVLSFIAYSRSPGIKRFLTISEQIGEFCLGGLQGAVGLVILLPWFFVLYLWSEVFKLPSPSTYNGFDLFSIYFLLPIALLTISVTAYTLSLDGFKVNYKPNNFRIAYNIFIYNILSICLAVIYFILVLLFR